MAASPIRITVHFTPSELDELQCRDKTVVVIDVLRASTTIITALTNGAKEMIPVSSIESAVKISSSLFGDVTLRAGERNGKRIEGFNLGNSPLEFTEEAVKGKSIIFLTTNGSIAMVKARHAKHLLIGAFVNLSNIVDTLKELNTDFTIICSGQDGRFCLEDAVCAGKIINRLKKDSKKQYSLDDAALSIASLDEIYGKNILRMLKTSEHGKYLAGIGFEDDLKVCSQIDSLPMMPLSSGGVIKLHKNQLKNTA